MSGLCTIGRDPDRHVVVVNGIFEPTQIPIIWTPRFFLGEFSLFFSPSTYVKHLNPIGCFTEGRKKHLLMPLLAIKHHFTKQTRSSGTSWLNKFPVLSPLVLATAQRIQ